MRLSFTLGFQECLQCATACILFCVCVCVGRGASPHRWNIVTQGLSKGPGHCLEVTSGIQHSTMEFLACLQMQVFTGEKLVRDKDKEWSRDLCICWGPSALLQQTTLAELFSRSPAGSTASLEYSLKMNGMMGTVLVWGCLQMLLSLVMALARKDLPIRHDAASVLCTVPLLEVELSFSWAPWPVYSEISVDLFTSVNEVIESL